MVLKDMKMPAMLGENSLYRIMGLPREKETDKSTKEVYINVIHYCGDYSCDCNYEIFWDIIIGDCLVHE